jgi:hypothetical protein
MVAQNVNAVLVLVMLNVHAVRVHEKLIVTCCKWQVAE